MGCAPHQHVGFSKVLGDLISLSWLLHSGVLSSIGKIFKEEGLLGFFVYVSLYTL